MPLPFSFLFLSARFGSELLRTSPVLDHRINILLRLYAATGNRHDSLTFGHLVRAIRLNFAGRPLHNSGHTSFWGIKSWGQVAAVWEAVYWLCGSCSWERNQAKRYDRERQGWAIISRSGLPFGQRCFA